LDKLGGASREFIESFARTIFLSIVMPLAVGFIFSLAAAYARDEVDYLNRATN
jgi:hypothetical protein